MMTGNPFPSNAWLTYAEATRRWGAPTSPKHVEYTLATPDALLASPAVQALIAAAKAEGMEMAGGEMDLAAHIMSHHGSYQEQRAYENAAKSIRAAAATLRTEGTKP